MWAKDWREQESIKMPVEHLPYQRDHKFVGV